VGARFPWGSVLALRCGSLAAPLDVALGGRRHFLSHRRIRSRCRHLRSRPFARSGKRTIDGAIRCRQLQPITIRRTTGPTPFQRRGCELPLVLLGPRRAFTVPCRSLTLSLSARRHARVGLLTARCAAHNRSRSLPRDRYEASPTCPRIPYQPAGKSLMVRAPRAPSVVSRVCKPKPAGRIHVDLIGAVNSRTDSPSVHHRSTSFLGALWLLPD